MGNGLSILDYIKQLISDFRNLSKEEQEKIIKQWLYTFLGCFLLCSLLTGTFLQPVAKLMQGMKTGIFYLSLGTSLGRLMTFSLTFLAFFVIVLFNFRKPIANRVHSMDERGVLFMEKGTAGTSRWMTEKEAAEDFSVSDITQTTETVYGTLDEEGKRVVSFKPAKKGTGNKNRMIFGSPGTGKSYAYVRTELLQCIRRGHSLICTDPSMELTRDIGPLAEKYGYDVKILNLLEPDHSHFWNCVNETIDPKTGRLSGGRLNSFAQTYMENSIEQSAKKDLFWENGALNVLKAAIAHAAWIKEDYILSRYRELYKKVAKKAKNRDIVLEKIMVDMCSFIRCEEIIRATAKEFGYDLYEIEQILEDIKKNAPSFTITEVMDDLMNFEKLGPDFALMPKEHPGKYAYHIFETNKNESVQSSILQGLQLRMQVFTDSRLTAILSHDEIDISQINRRKTAIFVIISDKSTATKPIASLFFNFFFDDAMDTWDKEQDIADAAQMPNPCLPVTVMLDEFFSLGIIGGDINKFATVMANSRKRQFHISIILQSWNQVPALYEEYNAKSIMTCCDTILFLGANDPETCRLISEFVAGTATVLSERHKESQSFLGPIESQYGDVQHTTTSRPLLTIDEVKRWKDHMLVSRRGSLPLKLKIFPYTKHPFYLNGEIERVSVNAMVDSSEKRIEKMIEEKSNNVKESQLKISSLKSRFDTEKEEEPKQEKPSAADASSEEKTKSKPKSKNKRGANRGSSKGSQPKKAVTEPEKYKPEESGVSDLFE